LNRDASIAYFVVELPKLGAQEFSNVIQKTQKNGISVFKILGDGKLCIFYYKA
jgi:hypothetical protein